jgi:pSer/pThr/pTyr-binding forkhead associated (FHA) protein
MPRLKMLRGPEPGKVIELEEDEIRIGRGRRSQIVIQDNEVSRSHCRLIRVLDDYEIHDLNSTNGTFVDGQKVGSGGWLLSQRVIIELGDSITFEYIPSDVAMGTSIPVSDAEPMPENRTHYLVVKQESLPQPEIYLLDRVTVSIGRDVDNDIVLQEPEASRHHVKLTLSDKGYLVEDLNTLNGTFVNDERVQGQHLLTNADLILIGTRLKIWYTYDPDRLVMSLRSGGQIPLLGEDKTVRSGNTGSYPSVTVDPDKKRRTTQEDSIVDRSNMGHGLEMHELEETVFLAYARDEWQAIVGGLFDYLHQNGIDVWADQYLDPNTTDWVEAIEQAQAESHCLVVIVSDKSLRVPYVQRSMRYFLAREKNVIVVEYGNIRRKPMMLQNIPAIQHNLDDPPQTYRAVLEKLNNLEGIDESRS